MSQASWSIAVYAGQHEPLSSPVYTSEQEARKAFYNQGLFEADTLPESYAMVLWEMREEGQPSAVLSKVVSLPVAAPEVWSPSF